MVFPGPQAETVDTKTNSTEETANLQANFMDALVEVDGIGFPKVFQTNRPMKEQIECIKSLEMREDDVLICAFPKCGEKGGRGREREREEKGGTLSTTQGHLRTSKRDTQRECDVGVLIKYVQRRITQVQLKELSVFMNRLCLSVGGDLPAMRPRLYLSSVLQSALRVPDVPRHHHAENQALHPCSCLILLSWRFMQPCSVWTCCCVCMCVPRTYMCTTL